MHFSNKIKNILDKPIHIFKIDNFLNIELYNDLKTHFPLINKVMNIEKNFGKLTLQPNELSFESLKQQKIIKQFEKIIYSENFFNFFVRKFYLKNIFSQENLKRKLRYLRLPMYNYENINFFKNFFLSKIDVKYSFSYIINKGGIVPHVDSQTKYLSLMLYFPENKKCEKYGTTFYKSYIPNYSNNHLSDPNDLIKFKNNSRKIFKTPFVSNCLYGFIRNNYSWHSVEPEDIYENFIRKSININFLMKN